MTERDRALFWRQDRFVLIQVKDNLPALAKLVSTRFPSRVCTETGRFRFTGVTMQRRDALTYHSERAIREFDLGRAAEPGPAARAHLELASLHRQRVRELSGLDYPAPLTILG